MRERIQKILAARGVGSRRQVEAWIVAGRITVNGKPASPGQPVGARDDIRLDGRRLRLDRGADASHQGVVYHRPAQEDIRAGSGGSAPSSLERLPKASGRRWIPISPLAARDGGLELFVTDGELAAALTRRGVAISSEYSVRVRGGFDEAGIEALLQDTGRFCPRQKEKSRRYCPPAVKAAIAGSRWKSRGFGRVNCGRYSRAAVLKPIASFARASARLRWIARSRAGVAGRSRTPNCRRFGKARACEATGNRAPRR